MTDITDGAPTGAEPTGPRPAPPADGSDSTTPVVGTRPGESADHSAGADAGADAGVGAGDADGEAKAKRRRRGSRGGRGRSKPRPDGGAADEIDQDDQDDASVAPAVNGGSRPRRQATPHVSTHQHPGAARGGQGRAPKGSKRPDGEGGAVDPAGAELPELPERISEGRVQSSEVAERVLVRRPQIGDSRAVTEPEPFEAESGEPTVNRRRRKSSRGKSAAAVASEPIDEEAAARRRGRERKGRPVGRYLMAVHVTPQLTQIAVLEGRNLIEHYVSRPSDDIGQIHGNVYLGRVQNVLPGMEAAFVDIATPKNAVLYRGDVQYDAEDIVEKGERLRIEQMLKPRQLIVCQVTKNPIGAKGARLTQEVSLPGRFVVLIPNSKTYGISKRLSDDERKRLRSILDRVKPAEHGVIVRTAAENVSEDELRADVQRLLAQWARIEAAAKKANGPSLLYREPDMAVRVIREEFNVEYRGVVIDDASMFQEVRDYVTSINPELADRIELYDAAAEGLPLFERHHVHEQLHKALDRKVWLPSGGSLIIEHAEALTVIDVNTGKNVGTSNLEETVFHNNLEAAQEIARQLRLRDIGGIIVIDFIDMEIRENRAKVVNAFRDALARDKTRTQVFEISDLGLVEMTRKRIGEGLLTSFTDPCPMCDGRGVVVDHSLLD